MTLFLWFLGPIGKWIGLALIATALLGGFGARQFYKGWKYEHDRWVAAEAAAVARGEAARRDADVNPDGGLRNDKRNRD